MSDRSLSPTQDPAQVDTDDTARRCIELIVTASLGGFELPMGAEAICELEDDGYYVDLLTGQVHAIDGEALP